MPRKSHQAQHRIPNVTPIKAISGEVTCTSTSCYLPIDRNFQTRAVRAGIRLAKSLGARVTALHTTQEFYPSQMLTDGIIERARDYEKQTKEEAVRVLGAVEEAAREAGVACNALHRANNRPWEEIIKVATEQGCDLIFMASHGRSGVSALLLGSDRPRCSHTPRSPSRLVGSGRLHSNVRLTRDPLAWRRNSDSWPSCDRGAVPPISELRIDREPTWNLVSAALERHALSTRARVTLSERQTRL